MKGKKSLSLYSFDCYLNHIWKCGTAYEFFSDFQRFFIKFNEFATKKFQILAILQNSTDKKKVCFALSPIDYWKDFYMGP
jgi:hypothetical protein